MHTLLPKPAASCEMYDICVITAANEHQAQGYWEQLRWRRNRELLPKETEFLLFADPQGKRIGSGGSTIYVLRKVNDFLQKPSYEELEKRNGLDIASRAFIDTGVINFGIDAMEVLMEASGVSIGDGRAVTKKGSLCEKLVSGNAELDIYREIPFAMLDKAQSLTSLGFSADTLQQIPFSVRLLPYCEFFHIGTSSILGSAITACLSRMLGQQLTQEDLLNRTLYMEQLMTTGGGWQDQIGGVVWS